MDVIKNILLTVFTILIFSLGYGQISDDTSRIVKTILENIKKADTTYNIILQESNDNGGVLHVIKSLERFENGNEEEKLDSLRQEFGLFRRNNFEDSIYISSIFNKKEYSYLKAQEKKDFWSPDFIKKTALFKDENVKLKQVFISYPVFNIIGIYALVLFSYDKVTSMQILKKENGVWKSDKTMMLIISHPRKKFIYPD